MINTDVHAILTVIIFIAFIALVVWAWSSKRKKHFEEASRIPLQDEMTSDYDSAREDKS